MGVELVGGNGMLGKMLIGIGALLVIMGGLLYLLEKNLPLGRLPGDIYIQKGAFTFYFPLVTCILLSLLLTILLNLILRH